MSKKKRRERRDSNSRIGDLQSPALGHLATPSSDPRIIPSRIEEHRGNTLVREREFESRRTVWKTVMLTVDITPAETSRRARSTIDFTVSPLPSIGSRCYFMTIRLVPGCNLRFTLVD